MKNGAVSRLPTSRPCVSGATMMIVSISPLPIFCRRRVRSSGNTPRLPLGSDINVLQLRIPLHRRHPQVSADAALLEAAEGGFDVNARVTVDAEHAGFDASRD